MPMPRRAIEVGSGTLVDENAWVMMESDSPEVPPYRKISLLTRIELTPAKVSTSEAGPDELVLNVGDLRKGYGVSEGLIDQVGTAATASGDQGSVVDQLTRGRRHDVSNRDVYVRARCRA